MTEIGHEQSFATRDLLNC